MAEWRDIPGFEGKYQVSDDGRIRGLDRYIHQKNRWGQGMQRLERGKELSTFIDRDGYRVVGSRVLPTPRVARLVAMAFVPNPEKHPQVNHKNGNRSDDRAENLEWVTNQQNQLHAIRVLGRKITYPPGKAVRLSKPGAEHIFSSVREAAAFLQVVKTAVMNAAKRPSAKSKGYEVTYV